ncbi:hypothetical protein JMJ35_009977 [Cladonia borealis]|uniref:Uncharacterized protein n=1 Tax=Cladonia borealis TaxID=184061 RepID=A0AA39QT67_9LECA|nr:hypothetical protein JMJ35_009977 [Cladonia borealis]
MNPTTSAAGGAPYRFLEPQDLGLPNHPKASSICGEILNPGGSASGVKRTVIGGIISIHNTFYAMTSANAHFNAMHPYEVQYESQELDYALCRITPSLAVPNRDRSHPLLYYAQEEQLTPGDVYVLGGNGPHLGYLHYFDTRIGGFPSDVKIGTIMMGQNVGAKFAMGAWVVRGQMVLGYVVHTSPTRDKRMYCHMIPIKQAFADIEREYGQKVVFGQELHDNMPKN